MKEIVLQLIKEMQVKKIEANIEPSHITIIEINQAIKTSLRQLLDAGEIEAGPTVNDIYIKTVRK